jgi:PLAT/LH2 domain
MLRSGSATPLQRGLRCWKLLRGLFFTFLIVVLICGGDSLAGRKAAQAAADVRYRITVETDTREDAGTDARVFITLGSGPAPTVDGCEAFKNQERELDRPNVNDFERGQTDIFTIFAPDVEEVSWICLRHDNTGDKPGWFVNSVVVQKESGTTPRQVVGAWRFRVFRWLATDEPPDFRTAVVVQQGAQLQFVNGGAHACDDFFLSRLFGLFGEKDIPDPGWVLVQRSDPAKLLGRSARLPKFRSASGIVMRSGVYFEDFPDVHDSHDFTLDLRLDPLLPDFRQIPILSDRGIDSDNDGTPDTLHMEWETGILTNQFGGDGRFFPQWAWPIAGDRVWANGYWIFDCGHPESGSLKTEIHPIRAIASMRQQVVADPFGVAAIPVTATYLYIHGRAGVATDVLECGQDVILQGPLAIDCPARSDQKMKGWTQLDHTPIGCDSGDSNYPCHDIARDHLGIPIDETFRFDVCTPPQPGGPGGASRT